MIGGLQEWNFGRAFEPLKVANLWHMFKPFGPHTLVQVHPFGEFFEGNHL